MRRRKVKLSLPPGFSHGEDFSFYIKTKELMKQWDVESLDPSINDFFEVTFSTKATGERSESKTISLSGRGNACCCYRKQYYCITLRVNQNSKKYTSAGLYPKRTRWTTAKRPGPPSPFDFKNIVTSISDSIWPANSTSDQRASGAVIFFGRTGTGKSTIAWGVVDSRLRALAKSKSDRNLHLVTLEDPIERLLAPKNGGPSSLQTRRIDYTPREIPDDAPTLADGLHDALRQTPNVVYAGEIRAEKDWRALLHFAGTGHLVVATAHAGSLIEAMRIIMAATRVGSPAERGAIARRIAAIVHLRKFEADAAQATVPSLWRRTPSGVATLVREGFSSLVPESGDHPDASCIGRGWYFEKLCEKDGGETFAEIRKQVRREELQGF